MLIIVVLKQLKTPVDCGKYAFFGCVILRKQVVLRDDFLIVVLCKLNVIIPVL